MKILIILLIASFFALIWMLKFGWSFDVWLIGVKDAEWIFAVDVSFMKQSINYFFYIPELLYNMGKENIKEFISQYFTIKDKEIYTLVIFIFHFLAISTIYLMTKIFPMKKDKRLLTILIIVWYLVLTYFI